MDGPPVDVTAKFNTMDFSPFQLGSLMTYHFVDVSSGFADGKTAKQVTLKKMVMDLAGNDEIA